ncbi:hypothetical protein H5410_032466 [Solanum commersonii]|uniref:Uncharacterized protein n=1 Tax=Solanum commersonii TaxID=4109 RepID=A0A9J5YN00_SOLCO|nr:hypothetical protein H5410_032466 [Solanum commersonii]
MATILGQLPPETGQSQSNPAMTRNYVAILRPSPQSSKPVTMRPISYLHGEPTIIWEEEQVTQMIYKENLQYAVIGKFPYGMPEIKEPWKIIPKQCELKGLPPTIFVKEAIISLAAAVGKPLQVDMATQNQTRPSCARVKDEVVLLGEFPKRINIGG